MDLRSDGGVNVPTLVAVEVLVGLSERSGLLPFICFVPFAPICDAERCSCASFCSFFCGKQKSKCGTCVLEEPPPSLLSPRMHFPFYIYQFVLSFFHLLFGTHHLLNFDEPLLMSDDFLLIAQTLFSFIHGFL